MLLGVVRLWEPAGECTAVSTGWLVGWLQGEKFEDDEEYGHSDDDRGRDEGGDM